jgi:hypothetical protein
MRTVSQQKRKKSGIVDIGIGGIQINIDVKRLYQTLEQII